MGRRFKMKKEEMPKNIEEALTLALVLAITAPDKEKETVCKQIADDFAKQLPLEKVEKCKQQALKHVWGDV
jgi:hypothetical protein